MENRRLYLNLYGSSDKWCTQGNSSCAIAKDPITINLPRQMRDTNYTILTKPFNQTASNYGESVSVQTKTTTNFIAHGYHSTAIYALTNVSFVVFGYAS